MSAASHTEMALAAEVMDPMRRAGLVLVLADAMCVRGDYQGAGDALARALRLMAGSIAERFGAVAAEQVVLRLLRDREGTDGVTA